MTVPPAGSGRDPEEGPARELAPTSVLDLVNRTLADPRRTAHAAQVMTTAAAGAARIVLAVGVVLVAIIVLIGALALVAGPGAAVGGAVVAGGGAVVAGGRALRTRRVPSRRVPSRRRRTDRSDRRR